MRISTSLNDWAIKVAHFTLRQHASYVLLMLTVFGCLAVAVVIGGTALGLVFNDYAIPGWIFVGGALLFRDGFRKYQNRLAVANTPTAKASSAAIGLAELYGVARSKKLSAAPVSLQTCAYWTVEARRWQKHRGRGGGEWHTLISKKSDDLDTLELEDETGRMLIWCYGAQLILKTEEWDSRKQNEPPDSTRRLLEEAGVRWPVPGDSNKVVVKEARLEEGGTLYVLGTLAERAQVHARNRPAQKPFTPGRRIITAIPVVMLTWFRQWMIDKIYGKEVSPPEVDAHRVLVWKGGQGRPFIIAGRPERETMKELSKRMWISLLTGSVLMVVGLVIYLHMFR